MSQSSIDSSQTLSKAPANSTSTVSASISKESLSSTSSSQPERLNSPSSNQRKRSKDSESTGNAQEEEVVKVLTSDKKTDPSNKTKRRRVISVTSEKGGEAADSSVADIMGEIASKVKNIQVVSATNSPAAPITSSGKSRKSKREEEEEDIDKLVEEIEKSGKSSSSTSSGKRSSHHSSSHKHRKDEQSSSKMSSSSGSHRKENRGGSKEDSSGHHHGHHRSSHKKESPSKKEDERSRKSSRKESGDSAASGSISSSKDCSERKGTKSSSSSHHSSSKTDKKRDKEKDKDKGSSDKDKVDKKNASLKKERSVDTMNRFTALQTESSPDDEQDESAYNSEVFDDSFDNFNYPPDSDEDDPEMVARECLEMFENYRPPPKEEVEEEEEKKGGGGDLDEGFCVVGGAGKKRVAHGGVVPTLRAPVVTRQPPATSRNLQGQLLKRFEDQSSSSSSLACVKQVVKMDERINGSPGPNFPKLPAPGATPVMKMRRIAHVPNAGALSQKPVIGGGGGAKTPVVQGQPLTYSQTAAKGVKREAHKPSVAVVQKKGPIIFRDAINKSTKIPHATRQQIMDKMFAEYCRLNDDHDKAFEMAVMREHELIQKCSSKQVYYSSGISIISGMRKLSKEEDGGVGGMVGGNRVVSHEMILSGGGLAARNCSVRTVRRDGGLPVGNGLYKSLRRYVMTEVQLVENGYPRPHPSGEPGRALAKPRMGEEGEVLSLTDRKCDRCKKRYFTREDGEHLVREVCNYHWGRKYNMAGELENLN